MRASTRLRFQLNTFFSGPQAWFFVAEERGWLAEEGLAIDWVEGDTAANTVPKMAAGGLDAGYGDINALIEHVGRGRAGAPLAVFASYNTSPYTIAVSADGPIRQPQDLSGKRFVAHPNDAAWLLFDEFCRATGLDGGGTHTDISPAPHSELVPRLLGGEWDGMFGFVNTLVAASIDAGVAPARLRHFDFATHVPDLYGMAIMVTRQLAAERPQVVRGLLRALNRGLVEAVRDPAGAIDALLRRAPQARRDSNLQRLQGTLALEMAHAEGRRLALGDIDDARFARGLALIAGTKGLPVQPAVEALFSRAFLPPREERVSALARP